MRRIGDRYEIHTHEIGTDENHVHFLIQSVPTYSPTEIITIIKNIRGKKIYKLHPEVKKKLRGGRFWTSDYYVNTVGQYGSFDIIKKYVQSQGQEYTQIYRNQLTLF